MRITEHSGGAGFIVSIVYLYYRVGMDSVGVAAELGLKPPHVRMVLWRLHDTWEKMESSHGVVDCEGVATEKSGELSTDTARAGFVTPSINFGVSDVDAPVPAMQA